MTRMRTDQGAKIRLEGDGRVYRMILEPAEASESNHIIRGAIVSLTLVDIKLLRALLDDVLEGAA